MRIVRYLGSVGVLAMLLCSVALAQTVPATAVPFITQVTPPSLQPGTIPSSQSNFTLTILGANFTPNAIVNLAASPNYILHPSVTTVNQTGSRITAQFTNTVLGSPSTFTVTVTNPAGTPPSTSNAYYLPYTPAQPSVVLNQNTTSFLTGSPKGIVAADFFGNGSPGLAVVSQNSNTVSILSSNFGGPFTLSSSNPTGNQPWGIVAADFLGGGPPDLAITNSADNTVTILFANGGGTYRQGGTISLPGVFPTQLVAADFNGDGRIDLAVLNTCGTGPAACFPQAAPQGPGTVTILLNNGDGTFTVSPATLTTGNVPYAIAAADLNGDGAIDLVIANQNSNNLTILMGNGDGTFTPATASPTTGNAPSAIVIGDFNGDGNLDLAVTNSADNTVSILLNQNCNSLFPGACSFVPTPVSPNVGTSPAAIATGDLNADGFLDLVVANSSGNSVSVLLGDGAGNFHLVVPQGQPDFSTGAAPQAVVLSDFNQDGRLDIVTSNASGSFSYLRQAAVAQLVLTSGNPSPFYGLFVTFTANLIPPFGQQQATGTMTFFDGNTPIGTIPLNGYQAYFQYPGLNAGSHQVTAVYSGDSTFVSVTSNAVSETVTQAQTTTTLTSNVNTVTYVQPFTLTATILPQTFGTATGTATFFDTVSSTNLGSAPVSNNLAQLTLSKLAPGAHMIIAFYQGDSNFTGSNSPTYTENVIQASTTVSVASSPNPITLGQTTTLTATIQPGAGNAATGAVIFLDNSTPLGFASVSNNSAQITVSTLSVGTHAITAQYSGDTNFSGSTSAAIPETVNPGSVTITVSSSGNPSTYGQALTFTASVQPVSATTTPTGTVTFMNGTATLGVVPLLNGAAQLTTTLQYAGLNTITAKYGGDSNYQASQPFYFNQNISLASTSTTVTSGLNPSSYSQSATFTATVQPAFGGSATGNVTFFDGANSLGSATPANNSAQLTVSSLSAGSHSITARYLGDSNTNGSVSPAVSQTVTPAPTTTTLTSSSNPSAYGQTVTFVASFSPASAGVPGGTLTFYEGSTPLSSVPISAGAPQITLSNLTVGTHSLTAQFTPLSSNYAASASAPVTQAVNQAATTTTVSSYVNPSSFGQSITISVTVISTYNLNSNGGTVTLFDNGVSIATSIIQGNGVNFPLTTLSTGAHTLTATYGGDSNLTASTSVPFTQTVSPAATSLTLALSSYATTYGQSVTMTSTVHGAFGGSPTGTITFLDGSTALGTATMANGSAQFTISTLASANHFIIAKYNGDMNFAGNTSGQATLAVSQATTNTSASVDANPATYGQTVTLSASVQPGSGSGPTGSITFLDGSATLGTATISNGAAQLAISTLGGGSHSITAKYSGDTNFTGSTSPAIAETVNQAASSTVLVSAANPAIFGQTVTLTATVQPAAGSAASGAITFLDGTTPLGTAALSNNSAQLSVTSLALGAHSVTVVYGGNANLVGSTSAPLIETINQAPTSITFTSSLNPATYGQAVTFVATVQPASGGAVTGTVTFFDGTTTLATAIVTNNNSQHNSASLTLANPQGGTHSITAIYTGDSNYAGSTSSALTETVNPANSAISLTSSQNPASFGQSVTLTAAVQPSVSGSLASGTVTFFDGANPLGAANLSNDSAQLNVSNLAQSVHSLTVKYNGDNNFSPSTSNALSQTISQASTTTTLASNLNPAAFGQSVTFTVSVQPAAGGAPTGTVTLMDGATSLASSGISATGNAQFTAGGLSAGTHSITAVYGGDANFTSSTSSALVETVNAASTTTTISSNANPSAFDQTITFTAAVQPPAGTTATGSVTFMDGSTSLGSASVSANSAQLTVSALTVGTHAITVVYAGNANLSGSTSAALSQVVNGASTTTTLASSASPSTFGQSVTLTATIQTAFGGSATGTVTFLDGTTSLGTASVSSNAAQLSLSALSAGSHSITAKYNGDANFSGSTSAAVAQTVNQAPTTTTVTSSPNPSAFGQTVNFTVSVQSSSSGTPTGNVTFFDGGASLGSASLSGTSAQLTLASLSLGSHSITAKYNGDSNYTSSLSAALTQSVSQSGSSTTLTSNANTSSFGQAVIFTAAVQPAYSGTPTGTVTFLDGGTSLGSITLSGGSAQLTLSNLSLGSHSITAKYSGDSNFTASTSTSIAQSVTQAATGANVSSNANPSSYGQAVTFTVTVTPAYNGTPTGNVSFFDGNTSLGNASLSGGVATFATSATALTAGSHSITAKYNGDSNFLASSSASFAQIVNSAATVTTLASNANPSAAGISVTFTAHVSSSVNGSLTGTVYFYLDGVSTPVASVSLSGGNAQYTTSSLSAGTHSLAATFVCTNSNFNGSASGLLTQAITDFSISASPASNTIARGSSGTYTLTLTPFGGLTGNVSLSCSGAPGSTTCSISPSQVTLNGTSSAQATVTIAVARNANKGTHTLTLKGTSGSVVHSTTVSLTIN